MTCKKVKIHLMSIYSEIKSPVLFKSFWNLRKCRYLKNSWQSKVEMFYKIYTFLTKNPMVINFSFILMFLVINIIAVLNFLVSQSPCINIQYHARDWQCYTLYISFPNNLNMFTFETFGHPLNSILSVLPKFYIPNPN